MLLLEVLWQIEGIDILIELTTDSLTEEEGILLRSDDDKIIAAEMSEKIAG